MESVKLGNMFKLSFIEIKRIFRSSKCLVLLICAIFININIVVPIRELSQRMEGKVSFMEPFAALCNSSLVLLLLPLLFIVIMADFPDSSSFQYFYSIRMSKCRWVMIQLLSILMSTCVYIFVIFLLSVILSLDYTSFQTGFSETVRYFSSAFPDMSNSYVAQLFPLNMLNQLSLPEVMAYSCVTLFLYLFFLNQVTLLFSILRKKIMGIVLAFAIVFVGTIVSYVNTGLEKIFPLFHTVSWFHFYEVSSEPIYPLKYSIVYMVAINLAMTILIFLNMKKVRPE